MWKLRYCSSLLFFSRMRCAILCWIDSRIELAGFLACEVKASIVGIGFVQYCLCLGIWLHRSSFCLAERLSIESANFLTYRLSQCCLSQDRIVGNSRYCFLPILFPRCSLHCRIDFNQLISLLVHGGGAELASIVHCCLRLKIG